SELDHYLPAELPLESGVPVQDVGSAHCRIIVRNVAPAVVRADEWGSAVRQRIKTDRRRSVREVKGYVRVARRWLHYSGRQVLFKILLQSVSPLVERVDRKAGAEDPPIGEVVGHSNARLKIV